MLGIVIVAHGELGRAYLDAAEQMMGAQQKVSTVSYNIGDDLEATRELIARAVNDVDTQRGVIIVTDMFGGTPCNLSISVAESRNVDVVSGVNLPMLLKILSTRGVLPLKQVVKEAKQAGLKYINVLSEILAEAEVA